eukprot:366897-Ditylum_brightwellii.AAC.1
MAGLHGVYSEGFCNLGWGEREKEEGECIVGKVKIMPEQISKDIVGTRDVLAIPHSPVSEFCVGHELHYLKVLWVGVLMEARFVEPSCHT